MEKFVPKKVNKEKLVISIRIETDILESVDIESTKADISRNEFIIQCIEFALNNMDEKRKKD